MVALCNRETIYIFILFLLSSFFSSPNLSGRKLDVYHTTWCGLSANLECMSEMCCTRLDAENIHNAKNCQKIRNLGTIAQLYRAVSLHVSTIGRKTCSAAISPPHVPRIW